jgi:hypothetical protein
MIGGGAASGLAAIAVLGAPAVLDVLFGMIGPVLAGAGTWILVERTWARDPARLTSVMVGAFAVKLVFFGAYVLVMLRVAGVRPMPFVVSFTAYFVAVYLVEAVALSRLSAAGLNGAPGRS